MPECLCQVQQESHLFLFLRRLGGGELVIFFLVISCFNFLLHLVWHFSSTNTMFLKYHRFLLKSWKLLTGIKEQQSTGNNLIEYETFLLKDLDLFISHGDLIPQRSTYFPVACLSLSFPIFSYSESFLHL